MISLNKKSQIVVYDFLFGFLAFIVIMSLVTMMWFKTSTQEKYNQIEEDKIQIANNLADILINSPGNPDNWEYNESIYKNSNFTIGLASDNNVLSIDKVNLFLNMNDSSYRGYNETKKLLRLEKYDYYVLIRDAANNINKTGKDPLENISVATSRQVIIDNEIKTLQIIIY